MKFIIRNKTNKKYVKSLDRDNTEFEYVDELENSTIFDDSIDSELNLFFENTDRLQWQIRPIVMKFTTMRDLELSNVEKKIENRLCFSIYPDHTYEKIVNQLGEDFVEDKDNQDVKQYLQNNFPREPRVGDKVCLLGSPKGMIRSRGCMIIAVDETFNTVTISKDGNEKTISFDMVVEDLDD